MHLEVGTVVLGEDDVHGGARNAERALQLLDSGQREEAFLVGRPATPEVGIEEGDPLRGVLRAAERQVPAGPTAKRNGDVIGPGIHHAREVLHDGGGASSVPGSA